MRKLPYLFHLFIAMLVPLALVCTRDTNPFGEVTNARAVIRRMSIAADTTVQIFSADTIEIVLAVAELVDSFSVRVEKNRYFSDTTIVRWGGQSEALYRFFVSFYDTGRHEIAIQTWRGGSGEELTERYTVHAVSPLSQDTVDKLFGEPCSLKTGAVAAGDVWYHWDFGRGTSFHSPRAETTVIIWDAGYNDSGWLWVSDVAGTYSSPKVYFPFSFDDRQGPTIVCVNDGYVGKDSIVAGSATFGLRLKITDRGEQNVYEALADGKAFTLVQAPVYVQMLHRMDTVATWRAVTISALDDARHLNRTTRTFYVSYDSAAARSGEGVELEVIIPPSDSLVFSSNVRYLFGALWNYTGDTLTAGVHFQVNDSLYAPFSLKSDSLRAEWYGNVLLTQTVNRVAIAAIDTGGDTLADTSITLIYDAGAPDTIPPTIVEVTADGEPADLLYTSSSSIFLRVVAFDEGSGLGGVTANGLTMQPPSEGSGHIWGINASLLHSRLGNRIEVIARDRQDLFDTVVVTIFRNSAPVIAQAPNPPLPLFVGDAYSDRISITDSDYDNLELSKFAGPSALTVDAFGNIAWTPTVADTGSHSIEIRYSDNFEPQYYSYEVFVKDTADFTEPSFVTSEEDFPRYLEAGSDSLLITLSIVSGRGQSPYVYGATAPAGVTQPAVSGATVTWKPQAADTGYQRLYMTVTDNFARSDTVIPIILVVGPNQACSLSVAHGMSTTGDGALDFTNSTGPETLTVTVHDPDHPLSEQHTVTVSSATAQIVSGIDSSGQLQLVIDPTDVSLGYDTLTVTVTDRKGHSYTQTIRLYRELSGLSKRMKINTTSSGANISENVYNFPLVVRLDSTNFDFSAAKTNGEDIRFRKADGTSLPYEIELWDKTNQQAVIWVTADTVYANNSTQYFEMTYGDANASDSSNGEAAFDTSNGFWLTYHLSESAADTSTGNVYQNSSMNSFHGKDYISATGKSGIAGYGQEFDGDDDYINLGTPDASGSEISISCWFKTPDAGNISTDPRLISKSTGHGDVQYHWWTFYTSGNDLFVRFKAGGTTTQKNTKGDIIAENKWTYAVAQYDGTNIKIYKYDGTANDGLALTAIHSGGGAIATNASAEAWIGGNPIHANGREFEGNIDEMRVSLAVRNESWIKLCYENQKAGSSVVTVE